MDINIIFVRIFRIFGCVLLGGAILAVYVGNSVFERLQFFAEFLKTPQRTFFLLAVVVGIIFVSLPFSRRARSRRNCKHRHEILCLWLRSNHLTKENTYECLSVVEMLSDAVVVHTHCFPYDCPRAEFVTYRRNIDKTKELVCSLK